MQNPIRTASFSALLLVGLAGCVTAPATRTAATPPPVYPTRERVASGQRVDLARNEPMGVFGTRAVMADAPACSSVRMSDGQPVRLRDQAVAPALAPAGSTCPERRGTTPYIVLNRAVVLSDGLYADNPTTECFLPNSGGGHCRPVAQ